MTPGLPVGGPLAVGLAIVATLLLIAGCLGLYAATKHQALLAKPASPGVAWASGALLLTALLIFVCVAGPATAVFIWMTGAMFVWSLTPVAARWIRWKSGEGR